MEWYKILGLVVMVLFTIVAIITDGFDWLNEDNDEHNGGIHP